MAPSGRISYAVTGSIGHVFVDGLYLTTIVLTGTMPDLRAVIAKALDALR